MSFVFLWASGAARGGGSDRCEYSRGAFATLSVRRRAFVYNEFMKITLIYIRHARVHTLTVVVNKKKIRKKFLLQQEKKIVYAKA